MTERSSQQETSLPPQGAERPTYDCPVDGVPKPERRKHPRRPNEQAEQLFSGFHNAIENAADDYWRGYLRAMRDSFAEFARAAPPQGASSGWKLMPVEPTAPMLTALWNRKDVGSPSALADAYRAMLDLAPKAPADPMDWPLPCDVTVGNGTHRKGTSLGTLVARMRMLHREAFGDPPSPEEAARNLAELQGCASPAPGELGAVDAAARWISVDDRMPEPDSGEVLVWLSGGRCAFDEWHMHREDPTGMSTTYTMEMGLMWRDYEFEDITHWMPIPQPPQQAPSESSAQGSGGEKV